MNPTNISQMFEKHRRRQKGLHACTTLLELIELIQQHRGITLATHAGNHFFETRLPRKQADIENCLQQFKEAFSPMIDPSDCSELTSEWRTIERHWPKTDAFNNFLIHSHYISRIQRQVSVLVTQSGHDDVSGLHQRLANLTLRKLPEMIESVAQSRGLAVYIASTSDFDNRFLQRLHYLRQSLLDNHFELMQELQNIDQYLLDKKKRSTSTTDSIQQQLQLQANFLKSHLLADACYDQLHKYTRHLNHLSTDIEAETITPDDLFRTATEIITALYQTITKVTRGLHFSADSDLSSWISPEKNSALQAK